MGIRARDTSIIPALAQSFISRQTTRSFKPPTSTYRPPKPVQHPPPPAANMQDIAMPDITHDSPPPSTLPTSSIPQKRPPNLEDTESSVPARTKPPREKKESWKKKEALSSAGNITNSLTSGGGGTGGGTGSGKHTTGHNTPGGLTANATAWPTINRWRLPPPKEQDYYGHRAPPTMTISDIPDLPEEFVAVNDHPMNRRGFRYVPCEASRMLPTVAYRHSEYSPYTPRINFEDMNAQVYVNTSGTAITTAKGWRMARANVGVREGDWYYECKIVRGINPDGPPGGHVRVGWARREAPLDAPVGFDAHSYGIRDASGQKVHMSRPKDFLNSSFHTGDVIGLHIRLPGLEVQRGLTADPVAKSGDIIRDRIPIRFKNQLWFEQFEYQPTKDMEELMNPAPGTKPASPPKTLPGSCIRVYKNGEYVGMPWEELYAFLPPASKPLAALGGRELDDGTLGYYPAVSVFRAGVVECNFGPEWWCPPGDLGPEVRPMSERYEEQIAEDVTYDLVDEVHLLFEGPPAGSVGAAAMAQAAPVNVKEEIKEMVMEDE